MTLYYVDPALGSGADSGVDWANAWSTLQRAIDGTDGTQPVAGDTIYCKHTGVAGSADETAPGGIDFDGASGDTTDGHIMWVGVNSSGVEDGARYVVDADSTDGYCIKPDSAFNELRNFHFKNAVIDNIAAAAATRSSWRFINVVAEDAAASGAAAIRLHRSYWENCQLRSNGTRGFSSLGANSSVTNSDISSNGTQGGTLQSGCMVLDSLVTQNGSTGLRPSFANGVLISGCVIDGNGEEGVDTEAGCANIIVLNSRVTNNSTTGVDAVTPGVLYEDYNVYYGNDTISLGSNVDSGGNSHGPIGDTSIPTVANRDVTESGYTRYTILLTILEAIAGTPTEAALGDYVTIDGSRGIWTGSIVSVPTGDAAGATFEVSVLTGTPLASSHLLEFIVREGGSGGDVVFSSGGDNPELQFEGELATDFRLTVNAILRREETDIGDGTNGSTFVSAGLTPDDAGGGGVGVIGS